MEVQPDVSKPLPLGFSKRLLAAALPSPKWRRWVILAVSCVGVLLAAIQSSALIIAFPVLIVQLTTPVATMLWVLLAVLLVMAAVVPVVAKLGDVFGTSNVYKSGFVLFTIGCLLCGFSQPSNHGQDLIGYRILTGMGSGVLFTSTNSLIVSAFAPYGQVGLAQGIFGLFVAGGSVLGPVIGGALALEDWHWIFFYNVPLAGTACLLSIVTVFDAKPPPVRTWAEIMHRFDWAGCLFIVSTLVLSMLAMSQSVAPDPNLASTTGLTLLCVFAALSLAAFLFVERRATEPLIPLSVFSHRVFSLAAISGSLMSFVRGSVTYNMIFFLQGPYGMNAMQAGIKLIPFGLGVMISGIIAGVAADKVGVRLLAAVGCLVCIPGLAGLAVVGVDTNYWLIALGLFVTGVGQGMFNAPNSIAGMMSVGPKDRGAAAAIRSEVLIVPQMVGIVITFSLVLNSMSQLELLDLFIYGGGGLSTSATTSCINALKTDYWILIGACVLSLVMCLAIPQSFRPIMGAPPAATAQPGDKSVGTDAPGMVAVAIEDSSYVGEKPGRVAGADGGSDGASTSSSAETSSGIDATGAGSDAADGAMIIDGETGSSSPEALLSAEEEYLADIRAAEAAASYEGAAV